MNKKMDTSEHSVEAAYHVSEFDDPLSMEDLTDDCLVHILLNLPLHERLRLECISRKWYILMPYFDVKSFSLDQLKWRTRHIYEMEYSRNNLTHCQKVMRPKWFHRYMETLLCRFGQSLKMLKLSSDVFRPIVTEELMEIISEWAPNLKHLSIGNSIIHIEALQSLKGLSKLSVLNAQNVIYLESESNQPPADYGELSNQIEDMLAHFSQQMIAVNFAQSPANFHMEMPQLQKAFLDFTQIDDIGLEALCNGCPNLDTVSLSNCRTLTRFLPLARLQMKSLLLNGTKVNAMELQNILSVQTGLTCLRIDNCQNINNFACLRSLKYLDSLWVGPSLGFGDADLARVSKHGKLQNVVVSGCQVTDAGLRYLATHSACLKELSVCHTTVTDEGIKCILNECHELCLLNMQATNITSATIHNFGAKSAPKSLRCVYVQNCAEVDESGFTALLHARMQNPTNNPLMIMAGAHGGLNIAEHVLASLRDVAVDLHLQLPLLALPFIQD